MNIFTEGEVKIIKQTGGLISGKQKQAGRGEPGENCEEEKTDDLREGE